MKLNSLAVLFAVVSFLVGCSVHSASPSSTPGNTELPSRSGFLSTYDNLTPSRRKATSSAWVYRNPTKNLSLYKMVMLDPVKVVLNPNAAPTAKDKQKLNQLAIGLEQEFLAQLGHSFPVVTSPGFGVMKIRTAITDLESGLTNLRGAAESTGGGAVGLEVEFIDSQSGEQIGAAADKKKALRTQDIVHVWALLLRDTLDEIRGLHRGGELRTTGDTWR
jgi:hypothetical protein